MPLLVNHSLDIIAKLHGQGITELLGEQNANKALRYAATTRRGESLPGRVTGKGGQGNDRQ